MLLSSFFFSVMAIFIRYTSEIPLFEQVVFRNLVIALLMFLLLVKEKNLSYIKFKDGRREVFLRCLFGFVGMVTNFYAVNHLNVADASAITKMSPFFVMIFAAIILKEKLKRHSVIALIFSIFGMMLVVRPTFEVSFVPSLVAVMSAIFAGLAYVMLSGVGNRVKSEVIILYFGIFSTIVCIPFLLKNFVVPDKKELFFLIMIGVSAGLAQFFVTLAYKNAPAGEVSIYNFSQIIFSILIGLFIFNERTDILSLIGMEIIILTAYYNFIRSKKLHA